MYVLCARAKVDTVSDGGKRKGERRKFFALMYLGEGEKRLGEGKEENGKEGMGMDRKRKARSSFEFFFVP